MYDLDNVLEELYDLDNVLDELYDLDNVLEELYDLDNVLDKLYYLDNVHDKLYDLDNIPDNLYYFQKYEFKYVFNNRIVLNSVKFLALHNEKTSVVPAPASGTTVLASEALKNIGKEISKTRDEAKKRRLETLDRDAVDNQNNDKRKQSRLELEDVETVTGDSGPSETVTGDSGPSASSVVEGIASPPPLTPSKGIYLHFHLLYVLDNVLDNLYE